MVCHQHFLKDIGTDLLEDSHDKLRNLFREVNVRKDLRAFARDHGRGLGTDVDQAREAVRNWQKQDSADCRLPEGRAGIATVRAFAQWALDYQADSLRQRRPERGSAKDKRQAIDIILTHLERHGKFLWGHAIPIPDQLGGGIRLVDRTNNIEEGLFHTWKHGERRRKPVTRGYVGRHRKTGNKCPCRLRSAT